MGAGVQERREWQRALKGQTETDRTDRERERGRERERQTHRETERESNKALHTLSLQRT